ncbi:organic solute transporter subunit beta isoform X2 [Heliangelus exortis]|uniref:organic solute transporter subunit beta isoform X2 n=1 Tax=Heliangelus exortis TaxID=472823 RepID=UPI003A8D3DD3
MKFCWIIPFFLLQGTEAFLMKNAKAKLCLQASPTPGNLLLEDCNPESAFQDWSWQGDWLLNRGTGSCLSLLRTSTLQTSPCSNLGHTSWDCSNSLLSPLGSSQGYLVANKGGVALSNGQGLKAQWQDGGDQSICEQRAEQEVHVPAALASTHGYDQRAGNSTLGMGMAQEELEELLWFFRREDASTWNYSVLALSFMAMTLGLVLLAINVVQNRKRKIHMYREAQQAELGAKQALMPQEYSPTEAEEQELAPQDQRSGEVTVQWKDGTVTSLYTERPEDAM